MHRLARCLQIKHFLLLNALFWSAAAAVALAQHYATTVGFGQAFAWENTVRHPGATYLSFWVLSFLVFDLYLATRRRFNQRRGWFWMVHAGGALVFGVLHKALGYVSGLLLERLLLAEETRTWRELVDLWMQTLPDVLPGVGVYFLLLLFLVTLDDRQRFREQSERALVLQSQLAQAQLRAMRTQLQPHFLFNALNTVAMMVRRQKPTEAIGVIASLSELLRSSLQQKPRPWVTLEEELKLVNRYLAIEQARYADRLRVEQHIAPDTLALPVPHLILQPVVENAFKHGIAHRLGAARLEISAHRDQRQLVIEVFNTGPALPAGWNLHGHRGIGLGNTVNRLMHLYGGDFRFQISEQGGGMQVRVVLPVKEPSEKENDYSLM